MNATTLPEEILAKADALRRRIGDNFRDQMVESLYLDAQRLADQVIHVGPARWNWDAAIDRLVTHPIFGLPLMLGLLALVFFLTVTGANIPSALIAGLLMEKGGVSEFCQQYFGLVLPGFLSYSLYDLLHLAFAAVYAPPWLSGFLIDGVYKCVAWVVSVMLPPMAIFFPMFTLLEDLGYLPRVAFNLDPLFRACGAHGKQALTMAMGFGCNAAGVTACRIIDSPREKLIAILTNNFVPCNGRFPTLIAIAAVFVAAGVNPLYTSLAAAGAVIGVVILGVVFTLLVSLFLSRTVLKGEPSAFTLELPPYRRPNVWQIVYTSLIDRTIFVLIRAVVIAAPAGAVTWLLGNIFIGGTSLAQYATDWLQPLGWWMGLDGVVLLAYIVAIPANEIVVPVMLMFYLGGGQMVEKEGAELHGILTTHGWTLLTAVCLMLFSLLHNPCGTTIWTIFKETGSRKWTVLASLLPLGIAILTCIAVAGVWRMIG